MLRNVHFSYDIEFQFLIGKVQPKIAIKIYYVKLTKKVFQFLIGKVQRIVSTMAVGNLVKFQFLIGKVQRDSNPCWCQWIWILGFNSS